MSSQHLSDKCSSTAEDHEPLKRRRIDSGSDYMLRILNRTMASRSPLLHHKEITVIGATSNFQSALKEDNLEETAKYSPSIIDLTTDDSAESEYERTKAATAPKGKAKQHLSRPVQPRLENSACFIASPFQLTRIRDLEPSENVDTVGIRDILGEVMIREVWIFNYMVDLDWVMTQFDPDIKGLVKVKIVHGSWRKEDNNRMRIEEQRKNYPNVQVICAYMPEPFGTHHSKMIVLFRHDDFSQVIIHTANMIAFDWTNMTQAVWRSPLLPLLSEKPVCPQIPGIGQTFKADLLAYFSAYGVTRTGLLVKELEKYSFGEVRAVFIGSVPGRLRMGVRGSERKGDMWGWVGLKRILSNIPLRKDGHIGSDGGRIVVQISSIATLGQKNTWLSPVLFKALSASRSNNITSPKPRFSIVFPTDQGVRDSLNGYDSGSAIHFKLQSAPQKKQLEYMRPYFCHWNSTPIPRPSQNHQSAGRSRAAPHIKTYIRFTNSECSEIDWAMLTSANLSTQAWGGAPVNSSNKNIEDGEVRICSWEAGVVVYPELFATNENSVVGMVPVFKKDTPTSQLEKGKLENEGYRHEVGEPVTVGVRMPYDLPLRSYGKQDMPWCASSSYEELDWMGRSWGG